MNQQEQFAKGFDDLEFEAEIREVMEQGRYQERIASLAEAAHEEYGYPVELLKNAMWVGFILGAEHGKQSMQWVDERVDELCKECGVSPVELQD